MGFEQKKDGFWMNGRLGIDKECKKKDGGWTNDRLGIDRRM